MDRLGQVYVHRPLGAPAHGRDPPSAMDQLESQLHSRAQHSSPGDYGMSQVLIPTQLPSTQPINFSCHQPDHSLSHPATSGGLQHTSHHQHAQTSQPRSCQHASSTSPVATQAIGHPTLMLNRMPPSPGSAKPHLHEQSLYYPSASGLPAYGWEKGETGSAVVGGSQLDSADGTNGQHARSRWGVGGARMGHSISDASVFCVMDHVNRDEMRQNQRQQMGEQIRQQQRVSAGAARSVAPSEAGGYSEPGRAHHQPGASAPAHVCVLAGMQGTGPTEYGAGASGTIQEFRGFGQAHMVSTLRQSGAQASRMSPHHAQQRHQMLADLESKVHHMTQQQQRVLRRIHTNLDLACRTSEPKASLLAQHVDTELHKLATDVQGPRQQQQLLYPMLAATQGKHAHNLHYGHHQQGPPTHHHASRSTPQLPEHLSQQHHLRAAGGERPGGNANGPQPGSIRQQISFVKRSAPTVPKSMVQHPAECGDPALPSEVLTGSNQGPMSDTTRRQHRTTMPTAQPRPRPGVDDAPAPCSPSVHAPIPQLRPPPLAAHVPIQGHEVPMRIPDSQAQAQMAALTALARGSGVDSLHKGSELRQLQRTVGAEVQAAAASRCFGAFSGSEEACHVQTATIVPQLTLNQRRLVPPVPSSTYTQPSEKGKRRVLATLTAALLQTSQIDPQGREGLGKDVKSTSPQCEQPHQQQRQQRLEKQEQQQGQGEVLGPLQQPDVEGGTEGMGDAEGEMIALLVNMVVDAPLPNHQEQQREPERQQPGLCYGSGLLCDEQPQHAPGSILTTATTVGDDVGCSVCGGSHAGAQQGAAPADSTHVLDHVLEDSPMLGHDDLPGGDREDGSPAKRARLHQDTTKGGGSGGAGQHLPTVRTALLTEGSKEDVPSAEACVACAEPRQVHLTLVLAETADAEVAASDMGICVAATSPKTATSTLVTPVTAVPILQSPSMSQPREDAVPAPPPTASSPPLQASLQLDEPPPPSPPPGASPPAGTDQPSPAADVQCSPVPLPLCEPQPQPSAAVSSPPPTQPQPQPPTAPPPVMPSHAPTPPAFTSSLPWLMRAHAETVAVSARWHEQGGDDDSAMTTEHRMWRLSALHMEAPRVTDRTWRGLPDALSTRTAWAEGDDDEEGEEGVDSDGDGEGGVGQAPWPRLPRAPSRSDNMAMRALLPRSMAAWSAQMGVTRVPGSHPTHHNHLRHPALPVLGEALFRHFLHTPLVAWEASTYVDKELLRLQFTNLEHTYTAAELLQGCRHGLEDMRAALNSGSTLLQWAARKAARASRASPAYLGVYAKDMDVMFHLAHDDALREAVVGFVGSLCRDDVLRYHLPLLGVTPTRPIMYLFGYTGGVGRHAEDDGLQFLNALLPIPSLMTAPPAIVNTQLAATPFAHTAACAGAVAGSGDSSGAPPLPVPAPAPAKKRGRGVRKSSGGQRKAAGGTGMAATGDGAETGGAGGGNGGVVFNEVPQLHESVLPNFVEWYLDSSADVGYLASKPARVLPDWRNEALRMHRAHHGKEGIPMACVKYKERHIQRLVQTPMALPLPPPPSAPSPDAVATTAEVRPSTSPASYELVGDVVQGCIGHAVVVAGGWCRLSANYTTPVHLLERMVVYKRMLGDEQRSVFFARMQEGRAMPHKGPTTVEEAGTGLDGDTAEARPAKKAKKTTSAAPSKAQAAPSITVSDRDGGGNEEQMSGMEGHSEKAEGSSGDGGTLLLQHGKGDVVGDSAEEVQASCAARKRPALPTSVRTAPTPMPPPLHAPHVDRGKVGAAAQSTPYSTVAAGAARLASPSARWPWVWRESWDRKLSSNLLMHDCVLRALDKRPSFSCDAEAAAFVAIHRYLIRRVRQARQDLVAAVQAALGHGGADVNCASTTMGAAAATVQGVKGLQGAKEEVEVGTEKRASINGSTPQAAAGTESGARRSQARPQLNHWAHRVRWLPEGAPDPTAWGLSPCTYWTAYYTHQCDVCGEDVSTQRVVLLPNTHPLASHAAKHLPAVPGPEAPPQHHKSPQMPPGTSQPDIGSRGRTGSSDGGAGGTSSGISSIGTGSSMAGVKLPSLRAKCHKLLPVWAREWGPKQEGDLAEGSRAKRLCMACFLECAKRKDPWVVGLTRPAPSATTQDPPSKPSGADIDLTANASASATEGLGRGRGPAAAASSARGTKMAGSGGKRGRGGRGGGGRGEANSSYAKAWQEAEEAATGPAVVLVVQCVQVQEWEARVQAYVAQQGTHPQHAERLSAHANASLAAADHEWAKFNLSSRVRHGRRGNDDAKLAAELTKATAASTAAAAGLPGPVRFFPGGVGVDVGARTEENVAGNGGTPNAAAAVDLRGSKGGGAAGSSTGAVGKASKGRPPRPASRASSLPPTRLTRASAAAGCEGVALMTLETQQSSPPRGGGAEPSMDELGTAKTPATPVPETLAAEVAHAHASHPDAAPTQPTATEAAATIALALATEAATAALFSAAAAGGSKGADGTSHAGIDHPQPDSPAARLAPLVPPHALVRHADYESAAVMPAGLTGSTPSDPSPSLAAMPTCGIEATGGGGGEAGDSGEANSLCSPAANPPARGRKRGKTPATRGGMEKKKPGRPASTTKRAARGARTARTTRRSPTRLMSEGVVRQDEEVSAAALEPSEPTPVGPSEPTPVGPSELTPVGPSELTPVGPSEPTPVGPSEQALVGPQDNQILVRGDDLKGFMGGSVHGEEEMTANQQMSAHPPLPATGPTAAVHAGHPKDHALNTEGGVMVTAGGSCSLHRQRADLEPAGEGDVESAGTGEVVPAPTSEVKPVPASAFTAAGPTMQGHQVEEPGKRQEEMGAGRTEPEMPSAVAMISAAAGGMPAGAAGGACRREDSASEDEDDLPLIERARRLSSAQQQGQQPKHTRATLPRADGGGNAGTCTTQHAAARPAAAAATGMAAAAPTPVHVAAAVGTGPTPGVLLQARMVCSLQQQLGSSKARPQVLSAAASTRHPYQQQPHLQTAAKAREAALFKPRQAEAGTSTAADAKTSNCTNRPAAIASARLPAASAGSCPIVTPASAGSKKGGHPHPSLIAPAAFTPSGVPCTPSTADVLQRVRNIMPGTGLCGTTHGSHGGAATAVASSAAQAAGSDAPAESRHAEAQPGFHQPTPPPSPRHMLLPSLQQTPPASPGAARCADNVNALATDEAYALLCKQGREAMTMRVAALREAQHHAQERGTQSHCVSLSSVSAVNSLRAADTAVVDGKEVHIGVVLDGHSRKRAAINSVTAPAESLGPQPWARGRQEGGSGQRQGRRGRRGQRDGTARGDVSSQRLVMYSSSSSSSSSSDATDTDSSYSPGS